MSSRWSSLIPRPTSKFMKVKCPDCGNEQLVFSNVASTVHCNVCGTVIAQPTGGRSKVRGEVMDVME